MTSRLVKLPFRSFVVATAILVLAVASQAQEKVDPVRKLLADKSSLEFTETPLTDVCEALHKKYRVNFVLDKKALEDEGIDSQVPITMKMEGISLESNLRLMLDSLGLTVLPKYESVFITTQVKAEEDLERKVYGIRDLMAPAGAPAGDEDDSYASEKLVDLISATVAPSTWQSAGGRGSIKPIKGMLVVSQTYDVHREIESLLAQLRAVRKQKVPVARAEDPRDKLLAAKATLEFTEIPLGDVIDALREKHKLPLALKLNSPFGEGLDTATPVTVKLTDVTLKTGLPLILQPLGLAMVKRNEVLVVMLKVQADELLERRIVDVRDLTRKDAPLENLDLRQEPILEILTTSVEPSSWEAQGGPGVLRIFEGSLVILQTQERHEKIEALLAEMRKVRKDQDDKR